jgi:hypothetical protein
MSRPIISRLKQNGAKLNFFDDTSGSSSDALRAAVFPKVRLTLTARFGVSPRYETEENVQEGQDYEQLSGNCHHHQASEPSARDSVVTGVWASGV